jgi:hypothetical protein
VLPLLETTNYCKNDTSKWTCDRIWGLEYESYAEVVDLLNKNHPNGEPTRISTSTISRTLQKDNKSVTVWECPKSGRKRWKFT